MGKERLKKMLNSFLNHFNAEVINNYFASEFGDDWDSFLEDSDIESILQYLNDSFIDIDVDFRETNQFEYKVKETIKTAIKMLESTK